MRTKEEIIEGNKLIAEFMGYEKTIYSDVFNGDLYALDVSKGEIYAISQMQYHTSWDWIMPVVEKIESFGFYTNILSADNDNKKHAMHITLVNEEEQYSLWYESKILAVYKAVVEFIKWYNQNTK